MKILVTGAAGFIGMHTACRLLTQGAQVVGIDNLNEYYDVALKEDRLKQLARFPNFQFVKTDLVDAGEIADLFRRERFERVVNLAAQAGVRYSLKNPYAYVNSNVVGFLNVLEGCRHNGIKHLVYASSSSVYGMNASFPYSARDNTDHPVSLYGATKKSNELMAHAYSHLYSLPTTGLRFFTVYGPWGRPDMATSIFTRAILEGNPIDVFNDGKCKRDFTYIDDIVEGVVRVLDHIPTREPLFDRSAPDPSRSEAPYHLYNIGNNESVNLMDFIATIEQVLDRQAVINMLPAQAGDVIATHADVQDLQQAIEFAPRTPLKEGMQKFAAWFRSYYGFEEGRDGERVGYTSRGSLGG